MTPLVAMAPQRLLASCPTRRRATGARHDGMAFTLGVRQEGAPETRSRGAGSGAASHQSGSDPTQCLDVGAASCVAAASCGGDGLQRHELRRPHGRRRSHCLCRCRELWRFHGRRRSHGSDVEMDNLLPSGLFYVLPLLLSEQHLFQTQSKNGMLAPKRATPPPRKGGHKKAVNPDALR